jgi:glycosyltransferase involved in cell wall biosynthesis
MRILHVTDGYRPRVGGIEVFVEDLAQRQAMAGHEVTVLTATPLSGPCETGGPVRVLRTSPSLLHPLAPSAARGAVLAGGYDVVHSHLSVVSPFATSVTRVADDAGLATVHTVHSMWASCRSVIRAVRTLAEWDDSSAVWTAVSEVAAAEVRGILRRGVDVEVLHNAVDVDWWAAGARERPAGAPVTLVSVMRLAGRKRPGALLSIVGAVRAQLPDDVDLRLLIAGDGPLASRLQSEIDRSGLGETVTLLGGLSREQVRSLYLEADVYVAPAYQESFGIAALEARAAGLPVVAMRAGGVGEFIQHDADGLLCDDDAAMVDALGRLVSDDALRSRIVAHNLGIAPIQAWPRTLAAVEDVYERARLRSGLPSGLSSGLRSETEQTASSRRSA